MSRKVDIRLPRHGLLALAGICIASCNGTHEPSNPPDVSPPNTNAQAAPTTRKTMPTGGGVHTLTKLDQFEIDSVTYRDGGIAVVGHASLPDASDLIVGVGIKTKTDNDPTYSSDAHVKVKDGKWSVVLDKPTMPEFLHEPHIASASWTPVGQSSEVLAITGEKGEKLTGPRV